MSSLDLRGPCCVAARVVTRTRPHRSGRGRYQDRRCAATAVGFDDLAAVSTRGARADRWASRHPLPPT